MPRLLLAGAVAATLPGLYVKLVGAELAVGVEATIYGLAILGGAFLLTWAAEVAQMEMSQALALAILALIAVLPEYAVDLYFAWAAADQPHYAHFATANMTGANRLLVGVGWPLVVVLFCLSRRQRAVRLEEGHSVSIVYLGLATLYSFVIPLKGTLSLWDTLILLILFGAYMMRSAQAKMHEPVLVGPAALLGRLPRPLRRLATAALFLFSGFVILIVAAPFAESLLASGRTFGIDEFLLVQWVAPLASEAPEFIIASLWALRGDPQSGLGALLSSKVNQWTLLVGTLPLVYSLNLAAPGALPLDLQQEHELWLTSAQSLFALAVLANLALDITDALLLFILFAVQFIVPELRVEVAILYTVASIFFLILHRRSLPNLIRAAGRQVAD